MARIKSLGPTEKELEILSILWQNGPNTVRFVNLIMNRSENTGYTTTLKQMQIMFEKGLLKRDESNKTHIYLPVHSESTIKEVVVSKMMDRIFSGSAGKLVLHALSSKKISSEELSKIKKIIDQKEQELKL
ncbi:MAG: BlaI/MecI/CopY family transcriptional regulator [bacterium]